MLEIKSSFTKLFVVFALFSLSISAGNFEIVEKKINFLLEEIKNSNGVFIRHGEKHTSEEAYSHIKRKFKIASVSPFTPSKDDWTIEFFIDEIASKSSSSGKDYFIEIEGKSEKVKDWLYNKLKNYK